MTDTTEPLAPPPDDYFLQEEMDRVLERLLLLSLPALMKWTANNPDTGLNRRLTPREPAARAEYLVLQERLRDLMDELEG